MRSLTTRLIALVCVLVLPGPTYAERTASNSSASSQTPSEPDPTSGRKSRRADEGRAAESETSSRVRPGHPPHPHRWAVDVTPALLLRDTAYRAREMEFMMRIAGRRRIWSPFFASAALEYSRRAPEAGALVAANTHLGLLFGAGAEAWIGRLRYSAQAQSGLLMRHLRLADGRGTRYTATRWEPTFGGTISIGSSFLEHVLLSLQGGLRFFAPKRTDIYTGIQVGWLFIR